MLSSMFSIRLSNKKNSKLDKENKPTSSSFSDFFRKASSGEKKKVFLQVAKEASEEQKCYMN